MAASGWFYAIAARIQVGVRLATLNLTGIDAVFFDAVGTLLHPVEQVARTYHDAAMRQGVDIDEAIIRQRLREVFAKQERIDQESGWRTSETREVDRWRGIVRETLREVPRPDECLFQLWEHYRRPESWITHPETRATLADLRHHGLVLGMASNFDARLAEIVAAKPDLEPLSERLVISSLIGWRKPAGEFFAHVIATAGCAPERTLHIGDDQRNDIEGARAAGLRTCLFDGSLRL